MVPKNNQGQILIEISVVMLLIGLIFFAATSELAQGDKYYRPYQLNQEKADAQRYLRPHKK